MPDFVLLNHLRKSDEAFIKQLIVRKIPFGFLDTEGGILENIEDYSHSLIVDQKMRDMSICSMLWGSRVTEYVIEKNIFPREAVGCAGSPRFDFYHKPWNRLLEQEPLNKDKYLGRILVNGSFPLFNPAYQTGSQEKEQFLDFFDYDPEMVERRSKLQQEALEGLTKIANELAETFENLEIVYRPHPFENIETYQTKLIQKENLVLTKDGSADGWIKSSMAVIHIGSTTAVEAAVSGIPVITPNWIESPLEIDEFKLLSRSTDDMKEMIQCIEQIRSKTYEERNEHKTNLRALLLDWYGIPDGCATERVSAWIVKCMDDRPIERTEKEATENYFHEDFDPDRLTKRYDEWKQTKKYFSADEISQISKSIKDVSPQEPDVDVLSVDSWEKFRGLRLIGGSLVLTEKNQSK